MSSLLDLTKNPIFKYLTKVQAFLDDKDDQLKSVTRSPYHLVAFLISWKLLHDQSKSEVIRRLNQLIETTDVPLLTNLTVAALDDLVNTMDWQELFKDLKDLNPEFLELTLPKGMISAINKEKNSFFMQLKSSVSLKPGDPNVYNIKTSITEKAEWKTPFLDYGDSGWLVEPETFSVSESLKEFIAGKANALRREGSVTHELGGFSIEISLRLKQVPFSKSGYTDYNLFINNQRKKRLEVAISGQINTGVYAAFMGVQITAGTFKGEPIDKVNVLLKSSVVLDRTGTELHQEQTLLFYKTSGEVHRRTHEIRIITANITVNSLCALYKASQIGVNFPGSKKVDKTENSSMHVALNTKKEDAAIALYPFPIDHKQIMQGMYPEQNYSQFQLFRQANQAQTDERQNNCCII